VDPLRRAVVDCSSGMQGSIVDGNSKQCGVGGPLVGVAMLKIVGHLSRKKKKRVNQEPQLIIHQFHSKPSSVGKKCGAKPTPHVNAGGLLGGAKVPATAMPKIYAAPQRPLGHCKGNAKRKQNRQWSFYERQLPDCPTRNPSQMPKGWPT
jgi:hypothetical protein